MSAASRPHSSPPTDAVTDRACRTSRELRRRSRGGRPPSGVERSDRVGLLTSDDKLAFRLGQTSPRVGADHAAAPPDRRLGDPELALRDGDRSAERIASTVEPALCGTRGSPRDLETVAGGPQPVTIGEGVAHELRPAHDHRRHLPDHRAERRGGIRVGQAIAFPTRIDQLRIERRRLSGGIRSGARECQLETLDLGEITLRALEPVGRHGEHLGRRLRPCESAFRLGERGFRIDKRGVDANRVGMHTGERRRAEPRTEPLEHDLRLVATARESRRILA